MSLSKDWTKFLLSVMTNRRYTCFYSNIFYSTLWALLIIILYLVPENAASLIE